MGRAWREQVIKGLVAKGNDEQAVRMIEALWNLEPEQINERLDLQMRLGRRYLILAMSQAGGTSGEDVEALLADRLEQDIPLQSGTERNHTVSAWYVEAEKLFSAVLERAALPQIKAAAVAHLGFVHALRGAFDLALVDLDQALAFLPLPDPSYWRGMLLVKLGAQETAQVALSIAYAHGPENERYCRAYVQTTGGRDV